MKPSHLDLFSGIGGFALAATYAGFQTIGFCENDEFCQKVLKKNFPSVYINPDIKNDYKWARKINLITGGFPCQPFSQAGNKQGASDDRYLWPEFLKVIKNVKPDWVIAENVIGLVKMELENILIDLDREGYFTKVFIIPACAANAPHRRDRLWIVANHHSFGINERVNNWDGRYISNNENRYVEEIQSKWAQFEPDSWKANTAKDWLTYNTGIMRGNDGLPQRLDKNRVKALGNAIVPQVVYPILQIIRDSYT